jgi:hypothetical protein
MQFLDVRTRCSHAFIAVHPKLDELVVGKSALSAIRYDARNDVWRVWQPKAPGQ